MIPEGLNRGKIDLFHDNLVDQGSALPGTAEKQSGQSRGEGKEIKQVMHTLDRLATYMSGDLIHIIRSRPF